jgi:serine/threonine protein phosphatase PrpC
MENRFPNLKLSSSIQFSPPKYHNSPYILSKAAKKSQVPQILSSRNPASKPSTRQFQSASRLPPLHPAAEAPGYTPVIHDPFLKLQSTRRTASNGVLSLLRESVLLKYHVKTRTGSVLSVPKPCNQDAFIVQTSLCGLKDQHFFAVCDGHGLDGHKISSLLKASTISVLERNLLRHAPGDALQHTIKELSQKVLHSRVDCNFSGSTFVGVLLVGNVLYCANVGDSRAVLGSCGGAKELSCDQKPSRRDEAERVVAAGGRVAPHEQGGPLRIWFRNDHAPGLAMTRSLGDRACRTIGLTSEPEICEQRLAKTDKFVIIASDGLWEFVDSEEAVEIVGKMIEQGKSDACCERIVKEAVGRWTRNAMNVDDITVIVVLLNVK